MSRRTAEPRLVEVGAGVVGVVSAVVGWLIRRVSQAPARPPFADVPLDDEPVTDEDEAAIREAMEDPAPSIPWEQVKAEARRSA